MTDFISSCYLAVQTPNLLLLKMLKDYSKSGKHNITELLSQMPLLHFHIFHCKWYSKLWSESNIIFWNHKYDINSAVSHTNFVLVRKFLGLTINTRNGAEEEKADSDSAISKSLREWSRKYFRSRRETVVACYAVVKDLRQQSGSFSSFLFICSSN